MHQDIKNREKVINYNQFQVVGTNFVTFGLLTTKFSCLMFVHPKCARFRTTLHFDANISGTDQAIDKRQTALSTTIPSTFGRKIAELRSTNKKIFKRLMFTYPKMNTAHRA